MLSLCSFHHHNHLAPWHWQTDKCGKAYYCFVLPFFEQGKTDLYVCIPADITSTNEPTAALQAGYCSALVTRESAKGMKGLRVLT
jgi:hypothetical protein